MEKGSRLDLALKRKERDLTADKTFDSDSRLTQSRSGASSRWSMASGKQNGQRKAPSTWSTRQREQRLGRMCGVCGKRRSPWQPFQQGKDARVQKSNPEQAATKQDKSFVFSERPITINWEGQWSGPGENGRECSARRFEKRERSQEKT